jgi:hypothetical protein
MRELVSVATAGPAPAPRPPQAAVSRLELHRTAELFDPVALDLALMVEALSGVRAA